MKKNKVTISGIDCYGPLLEDSNILVVGWYNDGSEMDDFFLPDNSPKNWTAVVKELKKWADDNGNEINELSAC